MLTRCDWGCAVPEDAEDDSGNLVRTMDIFLREDKHGVQRLIDLSGGDRIRFNTCPDTSDNYNYPYSSLVHEAGHALGIGHPKLRGSIMNYVTDESDCSPHPLDIAAIYALYQSVD